LTPPRPLLTLFSPDASVSPLSFASFPVFLQTPHILSVLVSPFQREFIVVSPALAYVVDKPLGRFPSLCLSTFFEFSLTTPHSLLPVEVGGPVLAKMRCLGSLPACSLPRILLSKVTTMGCSDFSLRNFRINLCLSSWKTVVPFHFFLKMT